MSHLFMYCTILVYGCILVGEQAGFKEDSGNSEEWVLVKPGVISHDEYIRLLARSTFALSPPGTYTYIEPI
jgi:hypothetical protein